MNQPHPPRLETPQTAYIRASYPAIEYLESGYIADWLKERSDQLLELAREERSGINANKLVSGAVLTAGFFLHALSPLAPVGVVLGLVGYIHGCFIDANRTGSFSPLPFIRGNILDIAGTLGNADLRESADSSEFEALQYYLSPRERKEYEFLKSHFSLVTDYLSQLEPLKRFHAYRWVLDCFIEYKGALPSTEQLKNHMANVAPDLRIDALKLQAIDNLRGNLENNKSIEQMGDFTPLPEAMPEIMSESEFASTTSPKITPNIEQPSTTAANSPTTENSPCIEELLKMPLTQRAIALIDLLKNSGFKIDEVIGSQVIAIASPQRGGKGTLAGILTILSKAAESALNVQYFTAGVDIYPFACTLHSALNYPGIDPEHSDKKVAMELLKFLKRLDGSEPYSNKNLLLIVDEAMRLLSLMDETDRTYALQFLLSRFAKTGGTLIIVLHASNLTSIAGKATSGLAATFKEGINFIGCYTQSVSVGGLRKINVASGAYFKANPNNFGEPILGGELGNIPNWLKHQLHPGNAQADPVRSLLKFFPELVDVLSEKSNKEKQPSINIDEVTRLEKLFQLESEQPINLQPDIKDPLSDTAEKILNYFQACKIKEPKTLRDLKKADRLSKLDDIALIIGLTELVQAQELIFNKKDAWAKIDW